MRKMAITAIILLLAFCVMLQGDTIELLNGSKMEGKILKRTETAFEVEIIEGGATMVMRIPKKNIHTVIVKGKREVINEKAGSTMTKVSRNRKSPAETSKPAVAKEVKTAPLFTDAWKLPEVTPLSDEDKVAEMHGRIGYKTPFVGVYFWVIKDRNYTPEKPAGLYLYYHGGGKNDIGADHGIGNIPWLHNFEGTFAEQNMIKLKMIFSSNFRNGDDQFTATLYAIAKVYATYKIIEGRGMITGFSRGGQHISYFIQKTGGWPFSYVHSESGLMWSPVGSFVRPMGWMLEGGQNEWTSWKIGPSANDRLGELAALLDKDMSASWELDVHIVAGGGHNCNHDELTGELTIAAFKRADMFLAPFIYTKDWKDPKYSALIQYCRERCLGKAAAEAKKLGEDNVITLIDERIGKMEEMLKPMMTADPVLAAYYAGLCVKQLDGHEKQGAFTKIYSDITSKPDFQTMKQATLNWYNNYHTYLDNKQPVKLLPGKKEKVEKFLQIVPAESLAGKMAAAIMKLE